MHINLILKKYDDSNKEIIFDIPTNFSFHTYPHYLIHQMKNGRILLIPYVENPYNSEMDFEGMEDNEQEDWENLGLEELGKEEYDD